MKKHNNNDAHILESKIFSIRKGIFLTLLFNFIRPRNDRLLRVVSQKIDTSKQINLLYAYSRYEIPK
jgi:hypothetical protein